MRISVQIDLKVNNTVNEAFKSKCRGAQARGGAAARAAKLLADKWLDFIGAMNVYYALDEIFYRSNERVLRIR